MRLLLDTHVALWAVADVGKLSEPAKRLISDEANEIFVSAASLWEIAIKRALAGQRIGRMPVTAATALDCFGQAGYRLLDISASHAVAVETLPAHHADPFDRILIAQALAEPMRLLTADAKMPVYGDVVIRI